MHEQKVTAQAAKRGRNGVARSIAYCNRTGLKQVGNFNQESNRDMISRKLAFVLVFFWLGLAIAFAAMSVSTYVTRLRMHRLMNTLTYEWMARGFQREPPFYFDNKPSVLKLESVFNHMLKLELFAFGLTSASALLEWAMQIQLVKWA
jgi:hypothetical protein